MKLTQRTHHRLIAGLTLLVGVALSSAAVAAESSNTVGDSIVSARSAFPAMATFISYLSGVVGICLVGRGLYILARLHDPHAGQRAPVKTGLLHIMGGGAVVSLPSLLGISILSVLGVGQYSSGMGVTAGSTETCLATSDKTSAIECVAKNIGVNVVPVSLNFMYVCAFIIGLYLIYLAIYKFIMAQNEGHQRATVGKTVMQIAIASFCCNLPYGMTILQGTLGIGTGVMTTTGSAIGGNAVPTIMTYTPSTDVQILNDFSKVISWCFVLLTMVGVMAYCKGLMHLYAVSVNGGGGRASLSSAVTFMVTGVIVANMKWAICIILKTFTNNDLGFCS